MNLSNFKGVYSATFTPYDKHGRVDIEMQGRIIDFQLRNGIKGLFVCGSTGEGPMLDESERILVAENAIKCSKGRGTTIIHVGHISADVAKKLSRKACEHGADAVSSIQPYYYHFSEEIEARYYQDLAESADIPMIVYIYPKAAGQGISGKHVLNLLSFKNVIGAKYTGYDYYTISSIFKRVPENKLLLSGADEMMMTGLIYGSNGSIGTFQNMIPRPFVNLYESFNAGEMDKMRQMQSRINDLIYFVLSKSDMSYFKAAMRYAGFDCGYARSPFKQLTENEYSLFAQELEQFDDLFAMSKQ